MIDAESYAHSLGIEFYHEYTAKEAAKLCRTDVTRIRSAKDNGELEFLQIGEKRVRYLGVDLIRWKISLRTKSTSSTSPKIETVTGAEPGTTPRPSKENLQACALETFKRPKLN